MPKSTPRAKTRSRQHPPALGSTRSRGPSKQRGSTAVAWSNGTARPATAAALPPSASPEVDQASLAAQELEKQLNAQLVLNPSFLGAVSMERFLGDNQIKLGDALAVQLDKLCAATSAGNMARPEAMLTVQAHTLDTIFNMLAQRAALNLGSGLEAAESYLRLAFRAQSQCRATLETLAEMKNPQPVAFVRQANIANGPQQVNVGTAPARAEAITNQQNKLLEHDHGERLDTRAEGAAGRTHPAVAALGVLYGPQDAGGQADGGAQRLEGGQPAVAEAARAPAT